MVIPPVDPAPPPESPPVAAPPTADDPEYRTVNDPALQYAWQYYITYDAVSNKQKAYHIQQRRQIITLGLVTTIVAVMLVLPVVREALAYLETKDAVLTSVLLWIRSAVLLVAPIGISALMAFTLQFAPSLAWVVHRVGAEKIRRDIYLYRLNADSYAKPELTTLKKQQMLRDSVSRVRTEVEKLEILIPSHQKSDALPLETIATKVIKNETAGTGYTDSPSDDGFSTMTGSGYVSCRVIPQRDWYVGRIDSDYSHLRRNRIIVLAIGALGALAAAIGNGWEQYVVVTTAVIAALTTYTQLRMFGQVYPTYHMTVSQIDAVLADWRGLPHAEREDVDKRAGFVKRVEDIFNSERLAWMEQATQAMVSGDHSLMRNVSDLSQGFGNQATPVPTEEVPTPGEDYLPLVGTPLTDAPANTQDNVDGTTKENALRTNNGNSKRATTPSAETQADAEEQKPSDSGG